MKQYPDLTPEQKERAVAVWLDRLLEYAVHGALEATDPVILQKIDDAVKRANDMKTPWFAKQYVMDEVGTFLKAIAEQEVQKDTFWYPDQGETCINL